MTKTPLVTVAVLEVSWKEPGKQQAPLVQWELNKETWLGMGWAK